MLNIKKLGKGAFHVFADENGTLLNRYGILNETVGGNYGASSAVKIKSDVITLSYKNGETEITVIKADKGYKVRIGIDESERLFGMGDATRDTVNVRGTKCVIDVTDITAYGPMPILYSSKGWGIIINSTYAQVFDNAKTDKNEVVISVTNGTPDMYILTAKGLKNTVSLITEITGKPIMLPKFAYGLTMELNEETDINTLLENVKHVRDANIPCDVFGLEPTWMEIYYDCSVDKKWNKAKFPLPYWHSGSYSGPQSFFFPLRDSGMQLELWLCENYDLFYEEERKAGESFVNEEKVAGHSADAYNYDEHLVSPIWTDKITKRDEPWFEHLKKFVDNGAACFKLDGYSQVLKHPDRLWALKYHDDEIHNIYPVILAKQMKEGFEEYTGRRAMIFSAGAYLGVQKYTATWAGDTGGGLRPLVSILNYAMCGHTNTTCDFDITSLPSIHYSFLLSWTQQSVWAYWFYPWYVSDERREAVEFYSNLRSSLFPYIYSYAHKASVTGVPVVRPLSLQYENTDKFDKVKNAFMLGESLLVYAGFAEENKQETDYVDSDEYKGSGAAETITIDLPDGKWVDYFDGKVYSGKIEYEILENRGGALFVKADSVIITMKPQRYILEKEHDYIVNVFGEGETEIYEDDGFTYDYENGGYAVTRVTVKERNNRLTLTFGKREGDYKGREDNGHDIINNSIPEIKGITPLRDITVILHWKQATKVTVNGTEVPFTVGGRDTVFTVERAVREQGEVVYTLE
ncbi:MAG: glycoside hydrolase family 31 protein [Clostridia bacterium]|nr:glycoside hydrolase family 31 protein [Clostridia bacterium]